MSMTLAAPLAADAEFLPSIAGEPSYAEKMNLLAHSRPHHLLVEHELIQYLGTRAGPTGARIYRARLGTEAVEHAAGTPVRVVPPYGMRAALIEARSEVMTWASTTPTTSTASSTAAPAAAGSPGAPSASNAGRSPGSGKSPRPKGR